MTCYQCVWVCEGRGWWKKVTLQLEELVGTF